MYLTPNLKHSTQNVSLDPSFSSSKNTLLHKIPIGIERFVCYGYSTPEQHGMYGNKQQQTVYIVMWQNEKGPISK